MSKVILKILHIIPNLKKGGAERLVLDICSALQKDPKVTVKLITFTADNEYQEASKGIDWEVIPSSIQLSLSKKNKYQVAELQKTIEAFQPTVIHTHLYEAEIVSRTCNYPKAKWFSHCHSNIEEFKKQKLSELKNKTDIVQFYERKYLFKRYKKNGGTHFIAISKDTQKYFSKNAKNFPITLLNNAINFKRFYNPDKKTDLSKLKLVNTGSFQDKKNQQFLVKVAQELAKQEIDFELHFLGAGKNKAQLEQKVVQENLSNKVFFHGNVDQVESYLWESNIYVHSAYYEPLGLVLIEAMAASLPVVCLDGIGNRDLIQEGKNGYLFKEQNAAQFTQQILKIFKNPALYQKMSIFAIQFARGFDIEDYKEEIMNLYV